MMWLLILLNYTAKGLGNLWGIECTDQALHGCIAFHGQPRQHTFTCFVLTYPQSDYRYSHHNASSAEYPISMLLFLLKQP